jgi:hypothetical protein
MKGAAELITLLLLSSSHHSVRADQPVHCLRENMYGLWDFHVSTDTQNVNLFDRKEVCTHNVPNGLQFINKDYKFQF